MKIKAFILFMGIFVIGFGAGFLVSGRLTRHSIEAVQKRQTPEGFKKDLYAYLKPGEDQKETIDSIIAAYLPRIREERLESQRYQKHLRDSMFAQIQGLLDQQQKKNLEKFEKKGTPKEKPQETVRVKDSVSGRRPLFDLKRRREMRTALAQNEQARLDSIREVRKRERSNPELRQELKMYYRQNILPTLLEKRRDFDLDLSREEKELIRELRMKRNRMKAEWMEAQLGESGEEAEAMRELMEEIRTELSGIVEKHSEALGKIADSLQPQREKWEAGLAEIKAKYISDYKPGKEKVFRNKERNTLDFILMNPGKPFQRPGSR